MIEMDIYKLLNKKLGDRAQNYSAPPPIFLLMQGEFIEFDEEVQSLTTRFPILEQYLNPYGAMQGGMIAAAVDNTLGPLSVLVARPNLTRKLEMTYSKPVLPEMKFISVKARFLSQEGRKLFFRADVRNPEGERLARAHSVHWVLEMD
jgi:acyl-coenzyme A thioesterase PaaI-like protein